MFYLDSRLTVTRRESSLIRSTANQWPTDYDAFSSAFARTGSASTQLISISEQSWTEKSKPKESVEKEVVTSLFEAMLGCIVESWTVIEIKAEPVGIDDLKVPPSEMALVRRKSKKSISRSGKGRSRTRLTESGLSHLSPSQAVINVVRPVSWWSGADERVRIQFRNGNRYEGNVSMKCMHGEGRFQWATGASYMGHFFYNELRGRGTLEWKDQTWYEGEFAGNVRHGSGTFVNSRDQLAYIGNWYYGTKNEQGTIYFSSTSSYDGSWKKNIRSGYGAREYCPMSGYKGDWDTYIRDGQGIMIWPNHDFYRGEWKDGVMSGYGLYIWGMHSNGTMSLPSQNSYKGYWKNDMRHGHGFLRLGFGNGSHYKGQFYENKKNGKGSFVTGDGYILQSKKLFVDDNLASVETENEGSSSTVDIIKVEPPTFDMCAVSVDFWYHIDQAMKGIDRYEEMLAEIINIYMTANKKRGNAGSDNSKEHDSKINIDHEQFRVNSEYIALQKAVKCYETDLKKIYYQYATIYNTTDIAFTPVLIRLFMWQMYYDCNMHEKGLTLVEIDNMLYHNPAWLMKSKHDPFQKVYYWQFQHSLITVANKLYSKKYLPTEPYDTILAHAFRKFMTDDILPNVGCNTDVSMKEYMAYIPLNAMYKLYRSIGEPHTIRDFLMAVRYPPHCIHLQPPALEEAKDEEIVRGSNVFVIGDQIDFVTELNLFEKSVATDPAPAARGLKLFNLGNLKSNYIIKNFANIFPNVQVKNKTVTLDTQLTFFEFYKVFLVCVKDSIAFKEKAAKSQERILSVMQNIQKDVKNLFPSNPR